MVAGAVVSGATLATLSGCSARAEDRRTQPNSPDEESGEHFSHGWRSEYGEVRPMADQNGSTVLALPEGFQYVTFSSVGDTMSDGNIVPRALDGMTCFEWRGSVVRLIRNHEVNTRPGGFDNPNRYAVGGDPETRYDPLGVGGTVTLEFDLRTKTLLRQFVSLNGTLQNCSGGLAWRNLGWISSEESVAGPNEGWGKKHGYNFFVPVYLETTTSAVPLTWMGRFRHEAAVACVRGIVYQTEDNGTESGFYRATALDRANLHSGGKLEMLAIKGTPQASLLDGQHVGARLPVEWIQIEEPDPDLEGGAPSCFQQGFSQGGAVFNRLEGVFRGLDGHSVYFVSTRGGDAGYGQLWHYIPADGTLNKTDQLVLVFESPSGTVLDSPDNLCLSPRGGMLFCEDDASNDGDIHPLAPHIPEATRLVGIGPFGEPFEFAVNLLNDSEFSGACFSPDGSTLFVNIYGNSSKGSGMTCAIWGPWSRGPL